MIMIKVSDLKITIIKSESDKGTLTVTEFAEEARITPQAVRKMISEERLEAAKMGHQYLIQKEELFRYLQI